MVNRLASLDVLRGLIMILLAAEACHLYVSLQELAGSGAGSAIVDQFFHHPWHGLRFWDLVQPAFMLMAGSALYIATYAKERRGVSWKQNLPHVLRRCFKLFICGTALHCVYAGKMVWELWNVLTQLAFTTAIAYFIIKLPARVQLLISFGLLLLTEILYRNILMPGFSEPFTEFRNFGAWFDLQIMGKINSDGWVAINIIPTAAHTIWGVLAGKLLISETSNSYKLKTLVIAAFAALVAGYSLDWLSITPIIKRISTSSFVLVSGGWVLLMLAALHWITDVRKWNRLAWIFTVVGTNAIFIYLFFETVGVQWVNKTIAIFTDGVTGVAGTPPEIQAVIAALVALVFEWLLCFWLYKRKIFFKL